MLQDIEKVKKILDKSFCFMEWQEAHTKNAGRETMDEDDIKYLLSLEGTAKEELLNCFNVSFQDYLSKLELLKIIQKARNEKKNGIVLGTTLSIQNYNAVKQRGYFVKQAGHQSVLWDEIYFSEDAFLRSEVSYFKNFFSSFARLATMI